MPDLSPSAELQGPMLRALVRGGIALGISTVLVAGAAYAIAAAGSIPRGLAGAGVAVALFALIGIPVALRWAVLSSLLGAVRADELGQHTLALLFDRVLASARGSAAAADPSAAVPAADAEAWLRGAVREQIQAAPGDGPLRRLAEATLLRLVEETAAARLRAGGRERVSLPALRDELALEIDAALERAAESGLSRSTAALALGAGVGSLLLAELVRRLSF